MCIRDRLWSLRERPQIPASGSSKRFHTKGTAPESAEQCLMNRAAPSAQRQVHNGGLTPI
eukprot:9654888-Alexandrium_andersonii.AAC.1